LWARDPAENRCPAGHPGIATDGAKAFAVGKPVIFAVMQRLFEMRLGDSSAASAQHRFHREIETREDERRRSGVINLIQDRSCL
jgi:hypothetical protein